MPGISSYSEKASVITSHRFKRVDEYSSVFVPEVQPSEGEKAIEPFAFAKPPDQSRQPSEPIWYGDLIAINLHSDLLSCFAQCVVVVVNHTVRRIRRKPQILIRADGMNEGFVVIDPDFFGIQSTIIFSYFRRPIGAAIVNNNQFIEKWQMGLDRQRQELLLISDSHEATYTGRPAIEIDIGLPNLE